MVKNRETQPKIILQITINKLLNLICNSYRNHPIILKINNIRTKETINDNTTFPPVSSDEVRKRLQQLNPRKPISNDKIPLIKIALIKIAAEPLSTPLFMAINNSFKHKILKFHNAKVACVMPLYKRTENKHSISNLRPVSILNTFSKIYENFLKAFLVSTFLAA